MVCLPGQGYLPRPLTKYWRGRGIKIAVYLDDGAGDEQSLAVARQHSSFVQDTLIQAGFVINEGKSTWEPSKTITWLGVTVDTIENVYYISEKRISKCTQYLDYLLSSTHTTARKLAKLVGMIISMQFVLKSIVSLKTRYLYNVIESSDKWDSKFELNSHTNVVSEIKFWKENIIKLNRRNISCHDWQSDLSAL